MVRSPSFDERRVDKPDPQRYLMKREGSPAGLDMVKRRLSASSPTTSPKPVAGVAAASPGSPTSSKKHPSSTFWRLYDRWGSGRGGAHGATGGHCTADCKEGPREMGGNSWRGPFLECVRGL